ncbi:MAG: 16S rRNA (cytosine(967)-C(5))-methyltransferase RsmB [candidate division Zixibacteria bacterium]|nr:16S rRNA (cytosine(967)-C(5))-methyltransferase RsmB [candidate division Zixibacteria bacterium]
MGPTSRKKSTTFDPVRAACIQVLGLVFEKGWKSDDAIKNICANHQFTDLDRRFLLQLCHGVIKMRRRLDYTYSFYLKKPNARIDKITRNILRLGLYQLMFTDRIPPGAAVSESVNLARGLVHESRGAFVNAILRSYLRSPEKVVFQNKLDHPVEYLADFYSYPDWFVEYCINEFGFQKAESLLARGNDSPHLTYRINRLRYNPEQLTKLLKEQYIEYSLGKYLEDYYHIYRQGIPLEQELIEGGRVYIQDEAAGMAVNLLNPKQRDSILDLCSAPGGKATFSASLMHNQGRITAVDISEERLKTVVENANRLGISIIAPVACDVLDFKGPACNRVLLDVPCSGWGVLGKHSDLRWMKARSDSLKLAEIQSKLIRHAADLVTPGGVLVYSTCTIIRDENDSVVEEFLLDRPDFSIDMPGKSIAPELISERGFVKTYPNIDYLDGAFCVRLKKKLGSKSKKP